MSEFHRRVEQLTNMKLIQGVPDSFKTKVKSANFNYMQAQQNRKIESEDEQSLDVKEQQTANIDNWDIKSYT